VQQIQWVKNFYAKILIVTYLVSEGHNIMQPQNEEHAQQYKDKLSAYLRKAEVSTPGCSMTGFRKFSS
jgi:hypothetical protein